MEDEEDDHGQEDDGSEAAGFEFKERKYRRLDSVSFWIRNALKKWYEAHPEQVTGAPYAEYEDILVFEKKED